MRKYFLRSHTNTSPFGAYRALLSSLLLTNISGGTSCTTTNTTFSGCFIATLNNNKLALTSHQTNTRGMWIVSPYTCSNDLNFSIITYTTVSYITYSLYTQQFHYSRHTPKSFLSFSNKSFFQVEHTTCVFQVKSFVSNFFFHIFSLRIGASITAERENSSTRRLNDPTKQSLANSLPPAKVKLYPPRSITKKLEFFYHLNSTRLSVTAKVMSGLSDSDIDSSYSQITDSELYDVTHLDCPELVVQSDPSLLEETLKNLSFAAIHVVASSPLGTVEDSHSSNTHITSPNSAQGEPRTRAIDLETYRNRNLSRSTSEINLKRPRESPNCSTNPEPIKKARSLLSMLPLSSEVVACKGRIIDLVSTDEQNPYLSDAQGRLLKSSVDKAIFKSDNISDIHIDSSGLERGIYRFYCNDDATKDWLVGAIPKLTDLWPNALENLNIVDQGPTPKLIKCSINMKIPALEPNDIISIIGAQNKSIDTKKWRFFNRNKVQNGKQLWFIGIDEDSLAELNRIEFKPFVGSERIKILVPNSALNQLPSN